MKILAVDDNRDNIELVCQILEAEYDVIRAYSGEDAIKLAKEQLPDLILLDVMMHEMDGYEVFHRLHEDEIMRDIPVIFVTALYKDIDRVVKGIELGAFDYIIKPVEDEILLAKIRAALRLKKAEQALKKAIDETERLVAERTNELLKANEKLKQEIKERERTEKSMLETEARYRGIFENTINGVAVFQALNEGKDFVFIDFNKASEKINKIKKEDIIGKSVLQVFPGVKDFGLFDVFKRVWATGIPEHHPVSLYKDKRIEGWREHFVYKLPSGEVVAVYTDVTDRKRAEEEIRLHREELAHVGRVATLGELAASLAHEINQPLTAILSNAQAAQRFLNNDKPDLEETRDILADIISDDKRAGDVIHRLRSLFRKGKVEIKSLDINNVIQEVISMVKSEAIIRNVSVEIKLKSKIPPVFGDRIHLQQLLINFILNASEAMANIGVSTRKVIISTAQKDEQEVVVSIRDYGSGIGEENLKQIFEPFYSTKPKGMGMGLSINRSIIEAHGGRLWAENNPDGGATFHFTIPIYKEN